jgi:arsenate reductase-like glutaredoxin family protein
MQLAKKRFRRNIELENLMSAFNSFKTIAKNSKTAKRTETVPDLGGLLDDVCIYFIKNAAEKGYNRSRIKDMMSLSDKKFDELIDRIEDEELLILAEARINKYGGWEEAEKHFISEEEFWKKLGIDPDDDLSDVEEFELE